MFEDNCKLELYMQLLHLVHYMIYYVFLLNAILTYFMGEINNQFILRKKNNRNVWALAIRKKKHQQ
jgi:hypothetical protein